MLERAGDAHHYQCLSAELGHKGEIHATSGFTNDEIVAVGRDGGHGFSFESAGLKTRSATAVAGAATLQE